VVRADAQARLELVDGQAELVAADERADARVRRAVARRLVFVRLELDIEEVDGAQVSPSQ
jgi:hypothetical protein